MSNTLYATFATVDDAERAAGAIMDHGANAQDISFIVPERAHVDYPTPPAYELGAAPPGAGSASGFQSVERLLASGEPYTYGESPGSLDEAVPVRAGYHYDALGSQIMDNTATATYPTRLAVKEREVGMATIPGNTPLETMEHEARPHIVDMNRNMPNAASGISTTTGRDAAKGAAEGAGIGLGLGLLIGLVTIAIPGVGLVAGAGMLAAGLAAATGVAGGIAGGVYGYLHDLGIPEDKARELDTHLATGGPVLSVTLTGQLLETEIVQLLRKYNATSVESF
jgi:hypothetical protein